MNWTLTYPRVLEERRPAGHKPRAPRWTLVYDRPVPLLTSDYLAIEVSSMADRSVDDFLQAIEADRVDGLADAPACSELLLQSDDDVFTLIHLGYWLDPTAHERWLKQSTLATWFAQLDAGAVTHGAWHEVIQAPFDRTETIYSDPRWNFGLALCAGTRLAEMTTNGYFGAARDRLPISAVDPLEPPGPPPKRKSPSTFGLRVRAESPHNMAVIRSGQFWEPAEGEQLLDYVETLEPKLLAGMDHLRQNSETTGTLSLRVMTSLDPTTRVPRRQTSTLGYFSGLAGLEEWAESHPTHLAIYQHAIQMNREYGDARSVVTWHEVFVLPSSARFEYVNCRPSTGLLPYAETIMVVGGGAA